jgi:hypothetical protein
LFAKVFKAVFGVGAAVVATGALAAAVIAAGMGITSFVNDRYHDARDNEAYQRGLREACAPSSPLSKSGTTEQRKAIDQAIDRIRTERGCLVTATSTSGAVRIVLVDGKWRVLGEVMESDPDPSGPWTKYQADPKAKP